MRSEDEDKRVTQAAICFLFGLCVLFVAVCLTSCKTQTVVVTQTKEVQVHDTLRAIDSVYIDRERIIQQKGDTVYKLDSVTVYKYKILEQKVEVSRVDSIPYPVEVVREVRKRNGYDRFTSWAFWIILCGALAAGAWWAVKKFYLHI